MKREYSDPNKDQNPNNSAAAIFSDIHRHPHHFIQPYSTSPAHFHQHPLAFPVLSRDADDESSSGGGNVNSGSATDPTRSPLVPKDNDGASIEVQRRPRGRPPGSKNKAKPPIVVTRQPDPNISPSILELANGVDILDALANYSRRRNTGLCILSASGSVVNVTFRQPSPNSSSTVTFHGRFDILSLSATFVAQAAQPQIPLNVAISLSVPQGQIIGGIVAGPLTASGTVYVVAVSFSSSSFLRLPAEDEEATNNAASSRGNEGQSGSAASGENINSNAGDSGVGAMQYSCSLPSDVIWAPTARQPY